MVLVHNPIIAFQYAATLNAIQRHIDTIVKAVDVYNTSTVPEPLQKAFVQAWQELYANNVMNQWLFGFSSYGRLITLSTHKGIEARVRDALPEDVEIDLSDLTRGLDGMAYPDQACIRVSKPVAASVGNNPLEEAWYLHLMPSLKNIGHLSGILARRCVSDVNVITSNTIDDVLGRVAVIDSISYTVR